MKKKKITTTKKLIEALNRLDEYACDAVQDTSGAEIEVYTDYTLLYDYIIGITKLSTNKK